jgi:hypothetical protein
MAYLKFLKLGHERTNLAIKPLVAYYNQSMVDLTEWLRF